MKRLAMWCAWAMLAAGCGDEALWARWQAESALGHARAHERGAFAREGAAADAARERVGREFAAIAGRFPGDRWNARAAEAGPAADVAIAAAAAAFEYGRVAERSGRDAEAIERWSRCEREWSGVPAVLAAARLARAAALERAGRFAEAGEARAAVAAMDPLAPDGTLVAAVIDAPEDLALRLRSAGRAGEAVRMLAAADTVFAGALARARGFAVAPLADALSRVRAARGDAPGALAALRMGLRSAPPALAPYYVQGLAARAYDAGAPESVFAYARWAAALEGSPRIAGEAWLASARAWEQLGRPDSALADYDAILAQWPDPGELGPQARASRANLLERTGQWERARAEYVSLAARYPTHELAFAASRAVVRHHLRQGEPELARVAGETAIANIGRMLQSNHDPLVQLHGGVVRADLLLELGRLTEAEEALLDLWRRFPEDSLAEDAGLRAARLAGHRPGGGARADSVLGALRRGAANAAVRREAEAPGAN